MRTAPGIKIAPSLLAADFGRLGDEAQAAESSGADMLHLDVMDGHFVPNITIGPGTVAAIRKRVRIPLDVHLMISEPDKYIDAFVEAGADILTVHAEVLPRLHHTLQVIRSRGIKAGVSINPATPLRDIEAVLDEADLVLLMTVNPGFGGQKFIRSVLPKIADLRKIADTRGYAFDIEVDGGITLHSAREAAEAGATIIVAGTAIFGASDIAHAIKVLREAAQFVAGE
ncbi:MAG: ribulose-phosphate 3-epimerase [Candidatus Aureabacteria bacterium]|nr:ribulose-phosphate 3-epimerase [Candidatus Auribacterota bacterium]